MAVGGVLAVGKWGQRKSGGGWRRSRGDGGQIRSGGRPRSNGSRAVAEEEQLEVERQQWWSGAEERLDGGSGVDVVAVVWATGAAVEQRW